MRREPPGFFSGIEWCAILLACAFTVFQTRTHIPNNFLIFRTATQNLFAGADLYVAYPDRHYDLFKYSPTFALVFWPFASLPLVPALFLWNSISSWVFARSLRAAIPGSARQLLAGLLLLWPFLIQLSGAQTNALVVGLMIFAVVAMEKQHPEASALAIMTGAMVKLFPLAAAPLAIAKGPRKRFAIAAVLSAAVFILAPLAVVKPPVLAAQYSSWRRVESVDALDHGYSVMGLLHEWLGLDWPNWPVQLVGTAILLLPLVTSRRIWGEWTFRRRMLASVLIYVVLFNHQAEYQSYLVAATGLVLWFFSSRRTVPAAIATALGMCALHPFPYLLAWIGLQFQLIANSRAETSEGDVFLTQPIANGQ